MARGPIVALCMYKKKSYIHSNKFVLFTVDIFAKVLIVVFFTPKLVKAFVHIKEYGKW